jgi:hypothetical protein
MHQLCCLDYTCMHLGIKQVGFGGKKMGDWEEGMMSSDYGYKHFKNMILTGDMLWWTGDAKLTEKFEPALTQDCLYFDVLFYVNK